jgi:regulator of sigma E protease
VTIERDGAEHQLWIPSESAESIYLRLLPPTIGRAAIGNPAYQSGLRAGDRVLAVNGTPVRSWYEMRTQISSRPDEDVLLAIQRGAAELEVTVHTLAVEDADGSRRGQIGITPNEPTVLMRLPFGTSVSEGLRRTGIMTSWVYGGLWHLVSHITTARDQVAGPITIVQMMGSSRRPYEALNLLALISISLMAINLLPIPILDGGHALFCLIEGVRGNPLTLRRQLALQKIGLVIIGSLVVLALLNDARRVAERAQSVHRLQRQETTQSP